MLRLPLAERLVQLTDASTGAFEQPGLIVIDEPDRVSRRRGLVSFFRPNSGEPFKFIPVVVATSQAELLSDDVSLGRKLVSVRVPKMKAAELTAIVD